MSLIVKNECDWCGYEGSAPAEWWHAYNRQGEAIVLCDLCFVTQANSSDYNTALIIRSTNYVGNVILEALRGRS